MSDVRAGFRADPPSVGGNDTRYLPSLPLRIPAGRSAVLLRSGPVGAKERFLEHAVYTLANGFAAGLVNTTTACK